MGCLAFSTWQGARHREVCQPRLHDSFTRCRHLICRRYPNLVQRCRQRHPEGSSRNIRSASSAYAPTWLLTPIRALDSSVGFETLKMDWTSSGLRADPAQGDVYLALDYAPRAFVRQRDELLRWASRGVAIHVVIYDLLPLSNPKWFTPAAKRNMRNWLRCVAVLADRAHCLSRSVRSEVEHWTNRTLGSAKQKLETDLFKPGSTFRTKSNLVTPEAESAIACCRRGPTAIMVGTVEPRKGHQDVLNAFEVLWREGSDVRLLIIGKLGWLSAAAQDRILSHTELGQRLHWVTNLSDNSLATIYRLAVGVIVASRAEGYGLPLYEAAQFGKPALARDIPVFRECIVGDVSFFRNSAVGPSALELQQWLDFCTKSTRSSEKACESQSWRHTAEKLLSSMAISNEGARHYVSSDSIIRPEATNAWE